MKIDQVNEVSPATEEKRFEAILRVLKGPSDEHKLAGLLMVAKFFDNSDNDTFARDHQIRQQICAAVGVKFLRKLTTTTTKHSTNALVFRSVGLNIVSRFCEDAALTAQFVQSDILTVLIDVLTSPVNYQMIKDSLAILDGYGSCEIGRQLFYEHRAVVFDALCSLLVVCASNSESDPGKDESLNEKRDTQNLILQFFTSLIEKNFFWKCISEKQFNSLSNRFAIDQTDFKFRILSFLISCFNDPYLAVNLSVVSCDALCNIRRGIFEILSGKLSTESRDSTLRFLLLVLNAMGSDWVYNLVDKNCSNAVFSEGKFIALFVKLASVECKMLLDDAELLLFEESTEDPRKLQRILDMLPVCYGILEKTIIFLSSDVKGSWCELPSGIIEQLKENFTQVFYVLIPYLVNTNEFRKTYLYSNYGQRQKKALDSIVYATIRVIGAWLAEESNIDVFQSSLVDLLPFLVLYQPLFLTSDEKEEDVDLDIDSDDEGCSTASLKGQNEIVDPLCFLLPGLLQMTTTTDVVEVFVKNEAMQKRLVDFCACLCANLSNEQQGYESLPMVSLCLGVFLNIMLEGELLPSQLWYRSIRLFISLGNIVYMQLFDSKVSACDLGNDERYLLLEHIVCFLLLLLSHTDELKLEEYLSITNGKKNSNQLKAQLTGSVNYLILNPPGQECESASDLYSLSCHVLSSLKDKFSFLKD